MRRARHACQCPSGSGLPNSATRRFQCTSWRWHSRDARSVARASSRGHGRAPSTWGNQNQTQHRRDRWKKYCPAFSGTPCTCGCLRTRLGTTTKPRVGNAASSSRIACSCGHSTAGTTALLPSAHASPRVAFFASLSNLSSVAIGAQPAQQTQEPSCPCQARRNICCLRCEHQRKSLVSGVPSERTARRSTSFALSTRLPPRKALLARSLRTGSRDVKARSAIGWS